MAKEGEREEQTGRGNTPPTSKQTQSGDPGRTPGSAEGDEETVDESLREKEDKPSL